MTKSEKLEEILNEDRLTKNWFSKNYFWGGTVLVILACQLLYGFGGSEWNPVQRNYQDSWADGLALNDLFYGFFQSFGHVNWQHTMLNMLCFLVVGAYLERKIGTLKLLFLVIAFAFLSTGTIAAISGSVGSIGYSGVNYAFYFYIIVDYAFMPAQKENRVKSKVIPGAVMLALIYLAMCFNGGTSDFGFEWYPWDLMHNMGHTGGAITGIIVGLLVKIAPIGKEVTKIE